MTDKSYETFFAGDVALDSGETLGEAALAYQTHGVLNAAQDNTVIMLTHFGGTHEHCAHLYGAGRAIDPARHFIVIVNLIGNGVSISPSNSYGANFPLVSIADNVRLQHRLLAEAFGLRRVRLAIGHSMGAVQAYHWAALFPDFVERFAPICGSAKISRHNDIFLQGMRGILTADPVWADGTYHTQPVLGLETMARAWAAWPPSSHFYRGGYYESLGYTSPEDFVERYWVATYTAMDANNILAQIAAWRSANISNNSLYNGDFPRALSSIKARATVMPCVTDAYFPPEDSELEVSHMSNADLRPIHSLWGHWAGSGRNAADTDFIDSQLKDLLKA